MPRHRIEGSLLAESWVQAGRLLTEWRRERAVLVGSLIIPVSLLLVYVVVLDERVHKITGVQSVYSLVPVCAVLAGLFGDAVCQPITLHVAAKRYLCFREPLYHEALSLASRQSLALQGGPFDAAEAAAFERHAYWRDAVLLRRFDDRGKQDDLSARRFAAFLPALHAAAR